VLNGFGQQIEPFFHPLGDDVEVPFDVLIAHLSIIRRSVRATAWDCLLLRVISLDHC
jgi:hypothetical protein